MKEKVAYFYADESWIEIEDKKHLLVGAICVENISAPSLALANIKASLGLTPLDEVKWNMKGLNGNERVSLSEGVIGILNTCHCTALLSLVECEDKQLAVEILCKQVIDFCIYYNIESFAIYFDRDMVTAQKDLIDFINREITKGMICIGIQSLESSGDQIIQLCDIFIGLYNLAINHTLKGIEKEIKFIDDGLDEEIMIALKNYITLSTRYLLWGEASMTIEEFEEGKQPFKESFGTGFRIVSTMSERSKRQIENEIATVYIGCIH